jgi:hypothetical protein
MLQNARESWAQETLLRVRDEMPDIAPVLAEVERTGDPFSLVENGGGLELAAHKPVENRQNRARLKFFTVPDGSMQGRKAVFFYKRSQIPFSRDRLSYGVCMIPSTGPSPQEIEEWLFFASTGFDPAARPESLRQAFAFTVPD